MQGFVNRVQAASVVEGKETEVGSISLALAPIPSCSGYSLELPTIAFESNSSAGGQLDGSVIGTDGVLLSGVKIALHRVHKDETSRTTHSDEWGRFSLDGITPGIYAFRATHRGYADFVIDRIEIKGGQRAHVSELQMPQCGAGGRCRPVRKIRVPELCL